MARLQIKNVITKSKKFGKLCLVFHGRFERRSARSTYEVSALRLGRSGSASAPWQTVIRVHAYATNPDGTVLRWVARTSVWTRFAVKALADQYGHTPEAAYAMAARKFLN